MHTFTVSAWLASQLLIGLQRATAAGAGQVASQGGSANLLWHAAAEEEQKLKELQLDYNEKVAVVEALKLELRQIRHGAVEVASRAAISLAEGAASMPSWVLAEPAARHINMSHSNSSGKLLQGIKQPARCTRLPVSTQSAGSCWAWCVFASAGTQECEQKHMKFEQATFTGGRKLKVTLSSGCSARPVLVQCAHAPPVGSAQSCCLLHGLAGVGQAL
jgi:hypothetical protein